MARGWIDFEIMRDYFFHTHFSLPVSQNLSNPLPTFIVYSRLTLQKTSKGFEAGLLILIRYKDILINKYSRTFLRKFDKNNFAFL